MVLNSSLLQNKLYDHLRKVPSLPVLLPFSLQLLLNVFFLFVQFTI